MAKYSVSVKLSDEQRGNLKKLAAYLRELPVGYSHFAMGDFTSEGGDIAAKPECGTAACAVGHGINAGVLPLDGETWLEYSERAFAPGLGVVDRSPWDWCFCSNWSLVDNTAHGAASRIEYMLLNGIPDNSYEQRCGHAPLSYTPVQPTTFPCGHPRTPANSKPRNDRPGSACRTCRRVIEARAQAKKRTQQRELTHDQ